MHATTRVRIKTILAPSDLTPASAAGVIEAARQAHALGAKLIVMTAILLRPSYEHAQHLDQTMDTVQMHLRSWFVRSVPAGLRENLPVRFLIVVDEPARAILKAARAEDVDLIVMAERPQSRLGRFFHKSTADAVVRGSVRPVLVVPTDGSAVRTPTAA